jgi:hypothetical protein
MGRAAVVFVILFNLAFPPFPLVFINSLNFVFFPGAKGSPTLSLSLLLNLLRLGLLVEAVFLKNESLYRLSGSGRSNGSGSNQ